MIHCKKRGYLNVWKVPFVETSKQSSSLYIKKVLLSYFFFILSQIMLEKVIKNREERNYDAWDVSGSRLFVTDDFS